MLADWQLFQMIFLRDILPKTVFPKACMIEALLSITHFQNIPNDV